MNKIAITINTRNRADQLKTCLNHIDRLNRPTASIEVIIVDNASTDATKDVVKNAVLTCGSPITYLYCAEIGSSACKNLAIQNSDANWFVFIDDDCYIHPDYLINFERQANTALFHYGSGQIFRYDDDHDPSVACLEFDAMRIFAPHSDLQPGDIQGANMFFHRVVFATTGFFNELVGAGTKFSCEDIEFAARASMQGFTGVQLHDCTVIHHHGRQTNSPEARRTIRGYDYGRGAYYASLNQLGNPKPWLNWLSHKPDARNFDAAKWRQFWREQQGFAEYNLLTETCAPLPWLPTATKRKPETIPFRTDASQIRYPDLSAIICTYNRYDVLPGAISSLLSQDIDARSIEIIVIDNSKDQEAAARFSAQHQNPRVRYILEPTPGLSNARNVGAKLATGAYVAYIDDDAIAKPDWARSIIAGFQNDETKPGVVGGKINPRWTSTRPDWLKDDLLGYLSIVNWGDTAHILQPGEWLAGCNIAFDRKLLNTLGGFSLALGRTSSILLSNEEAELVQKCISNGRSAKYLPDAVVDHIIDPERLSRRWFHRRVVWQAISDYMQDPASIEKLHSESQSDLRSSNSSNPANEPFDAKTIYAEIAAALAGVKLDTSSTRAAMAD